MIGKYFEKTGEIELSGNVDEFNSLSKQILINKSKITLEDKELDSFLDGKILDYIQINHLASHCLVKVSVKDSSLVIEGSPEKLKVLSNNIAVGEEKVENYHIHIEFYEDHFYLSPESSPLIVQYT